MCIVLNGYITNIIEIGKFTVLNNVLNARLFNDCLMTLMYNSSLPTATAGAN